MTKRLIINFLIDRINIIVIFLLNTLLLVLFFNVAPGTRKEIIYPFVISGFLLILLILTEWIKYYRFNKNLVRLGDNFNVYLGPVTSEQKEINRVVRLAYEKHMGEINSAEASNKAKSYFIAQWIHTLKTPISIIDLLVQKSLAEGRDQIEVMSDIRIENQRLQNSIEQVLSLLRLDELEKDYEPEKIDLVQSIKKLLNDRKKQFILSGVFPLLELQEDKVFIITDRKWNEIMIDQVISNAIKYSNEKGKEKNIYISIYFKEDNVVLSIRDEGIGIPSYDIDRVFEPFFTGENGRKNRNATGIGLYVCDQIARRLGHSIEIESQQGKGTKVVIEYSKQSYITKL